MYSTYYLLAHTRYILHVSAPAQIDVSGVAMQLRLLKYSLYIAWRQKIGRVKMAYQGSISM